MKNLLSMALLAFAVGILPSCAAAVNSNTSVNTRGRSHHHQRAAGTNIGANVNVGL